MTFFLSIAKPKFLRIFLVKLPFFRYNLGTEGIKHGIDKIEKMAIYSLKLHIHVFQCVPMFSNVTIMQFLFPPCFSMCFIVFSFFAVFAVLVIFLCKTTSFIVNYICTFIHSLYHFNTLHFIKNVTFKITHIVNTHNVTLFAFFYPIIQLYVTDFEIGRPTAGRPTVHTVPHGESTYY